MAYKVLVRFADLQDNKRLYLAGEIFPRDGLTVTAARLVELSGSNNLAGYPLIEKVADADEPNAETKVPRKRVKRDAE